MQLSLSIVALAITTTFTSASPLAKRDVTVNFDSRVFINKGLVGFGRIPHDAVDSFGETLGGLGSAIALQSFTKSADGKFIGKILLQPDRGHNTVTTTDFRARSHSFNFTFDATSTTGPAENIALQYRSTTLYREGPTFSGRFNATTGLDPNAVRNATRFSPAYGVAAPNGHISVDAEGLALDPTGLIQYVSDEYGPYIHAINRQTGLILYTITPPAAVLPTLNGALNFSSGVTPDSGRAPNQGFEGLSIERTKGGLLWALTQSALVQDSVRASKETNRNARLFAWDVKIPGRPKLVHEYIVQLPISKKLRTRAQSEIHVVDNSTLLVLARDGNGFGDSDPASSYKQADLISIKGATDLAGSKYDEAANPVAPGGVLLPEITPVQYASFISLVDPAQLAKFGLQAKGPIDRTLIASKLESLAVASAQDEANPDDHFVFVVSDNDFITTNGKQAAQAANGDYVIESYADEYAVKNGPADTQVFIYRAALPGYVQ